MLAGFDPHHDHLTARSTTATRLSQRLVLYMAATFDFECESWGVSGAFLKGFTFDKARKLLQQKGMLVPVRNVVIIPPKVWQHLARFDPTSTFETHGNFHLEATRSEPIPC